MTKRTFEAIFLPAIVLQSVIMGGGYASGREVVQYAGRFGERGWVAVAIILGGFTVLSILAFELARVSRSYDYKKWIRELIGPLWPLFDLLAITMMLLVIAVMSAAMSSILRQTLGIPTWLGLAIAFVVVAVLAWRGATVMEHFKVIGSVLLYVGYAAFSTFVLLAPLPEIAATSAAPPDPAWGAVIVSGLVYIGYNLSVYPAGLFCLHRQSSRRDTVLSGLASGAMMTIPLILTFMCLVRFYPSADVLEAEIPWLAMFAAASGGRLWVALFGFIAGWTLLETAIASIHALVDRFDKNLDDLPRTIRPASPMTQQQKMWVSVAVLAIATLLARFGIIALVAEGYSRLAWGFILLLGVPLLTVGVRRILRAGALDTSRPS